MAVDIVKWVRQIWVGPPMPDVEQERTSGVKAAAINAGWNYCLYGLHELSCELGHDLAMERLAEYCAMVPTACHFAGLVSDYARLALLDRWGGLYLDTDWIWRGKAWPIFPEAPDLYGRPMHRGYQTNSVLWAPVPGVDKCKKLHEAAFNKICGILPPPETIKMPATDFVANISKRVDFIVGPFWIGAKFGKILSPLSKAIVSYHYEHCASPLMHRARGRWTV